MNKEECLLCGDTFETREELEQHHLESHEIEEDDDLRWWHWVIAIPLLLFAGWRWLLGLVFVGAVIAGALGIFDKTPAPEIRKCPGYAFVHRMERAGQIDSFASVKPESGWLCEYTVEDEETEIRFRRVRGGRELELEFEGRPPSVEKVERWAVREGYSEYP